MSYIAQVVQFNQDVLRIPQRKLDMLPSNEFEISMKCLNEELQEFKEAYEKGDFVGCVDGVIDLTYFAFGVLYKMGLTSETIQNCCAAVHNANMEKKLGVVERRAVGGAHDAVKPEGWVSPEERIIELLDKQANDNNS